MKFEIDRDRCVACLACVRVCPTDAVAVFDGERPLLEVEDSSCIRCGLCLPACPHDAINVTGQAGRALAIAQEGDGTLILSPECVVHFYPATPEQVVNACYAAGFRSVTRGVIGDELVAAEYLRLWREGEWQTLIRSTDPVVVETVRTQFPELLGYLAPVVAPCVAEARYLRARNGEDARVVYAGVFVPTESAELDAAVTFAELEQIFRARGVDLFSQPTVFERIPEERRRHLSTAGGLPLAMLEGSTQSSRVFRTVRGLAGLAAIARAVTVDRIALGFVDVMSYDGMLDHPLFGPKEQLYWRRSVLASTEPPRSTQPVVEDGPVVSVRTVFAARSAPREEPDAAAVSSLLATIGVGPNGAAWDCGACGYATCHRFAKAAVQGRATLRQCVVHLGKDAAEARQLAAIDPLTGLATYRVLRDRLSSEVERSRRSEERFAVLFLDLDRFKAVNDRFGHEGGNAVLREVAAAVRETVRASDLAARYGGDEFVVLLTRTDLAGANRVAEAIREAVEGVGRKLGFPDGMVTVSVGIADFDPRSDAETDLLVSADRALYRAKASGRNAVA